MRNILFISATHGNEGFSADVLKEIEQTYDPAQYGYDWIIGNPPAFEQDVRFTDTDLNRSAPGNPNSSSYEERRAAEIVELSQNYDAVIDIHGTVADCGLIKLIPNPTVENLALARMIPLARNVTWYAEESVISGPLTQHTRCPAVEIECGPKADKAISEQLKEVIGGILMANFNGDETQPITQEYYSVYGPEEGEPNDAVQDFKEITLNGETFFPLLSGNQYPGIVCYKMRKITEEEAVL